MSKRMILAALAAASMAASAVTDEQLLSMMRVQYENDMKTESGIVKWHGRLQHQAVDTNALTKICRYADGYVQTNTWKLVTPRDAAQERIRKLSVSTNGVPAKLAAARVRRLNAIRQGVTNVTVTVTANRQK